MVSSHYQMVSKVVFLDIDGVLIPLDALLSENMMPDPQCVENLNWLIRKTGAAIVVSSSWRQLGYASVKGILQKWGVTGDIIDVTPESDIALANHRGQEIRLWLDFSPNVKAFVILDDHNDMGHLSDYLVLTAIENGLTREDVIKAADIIQRQLI